MFPAFQYLIVMNLFLCTFSPSLGVLPCSEASIDFFFFFPSHCWKLQIQAVSSGPGTSVLYGHSQTVSVCWSCSSLHRTCCSVFHFVGGTLHKGICRTLIFWMFFLGVTKNSYNFMWDLVSTKLGKVQTVIICHVFHPESKHSLMARGNAWRKVWDYRGRKYTLLHGEWSLLLPWQLLGQCLQRERS